MRWTGRSQKQRACMNCFNSFQASIPQGPVIHRCGVSRCSVRHRWTFRNVDQCPSHLDMLVVEFISGSFTYNGRILTVLVLAGRFLPSHRLGSYLLVSQEVWRPPEHLIITAVRLRVRFTQDHTALVPRAMATSQRFVFAGVCSLVFSPVPGYRASCSTLAICKYVHEYI